VLVLARGIVNVPNFFLGLKKHVDLAAESRTERLERAIGEILLTGNGIDESLCSCALA
jgi:hypothetical protein